MYIDKKLETYNIGSGQFSFLMRLYHNEGISQGSLAHSLRVDKATSARAIKKLMKEGYVARQRDTADKRAYRIFLTIKGKKMESTIKKISSEVKEIVLSTFPEDEKKLIIKLLKRMAQNALSLKQ
jgi:DNA-binding MarR family transcriptional regulator